MRASSPGRGPGLASRSRSAPEALADHSADPTGHNPFTPETTLAQVPPPYTTVAFLPGPFTGDKSYGLRDFTDGKWPKD